MPSSVGRPDKLMDLESASPSDDSEDEDDDHVLDNVEAGDDEEEITYQGWLSIS